MTRRRQVKIRAVPDVRDESSDKIPPRQQQSPPPDPPDETVAPTIKKILASPILTPEEVAVLYRVSPETVMQMASDGTLPPLKMKNETRFLRKDVLVFLRDLRDQDKHPRRFTIDK